MNDHQDICEALKDLDVTHLVDLGGVLGLSRNTCRKISIVGDLVASWLRREDNVLQKSGEPTWSRLADALDKIGQRGISQDITCRYAANTDRSNSQLSEATGVSALVPPIDTGGKLYYIMHVVDGLHTACI